MDGPTYQPTSLFSSYVFLLLGLICATILVPGGAKGVDMKSNSPNIYVYAETFGCARTARNRFKVILACSSNLSHSESGKLGSTLANPALT